MSFLLGELGLELHKDKSGILKLGNGIGFLGFRIFFHHKLVRKSNLRKFEQKFKRLEKLYKIDEIKREKVVEFLQGWLNYVSYGNTYKYRRNVLKIFNRCFPFRMYRKKFKKYKKFVREVEHSRIEFSVQKTLFLYKKGLSVEKIASKMGIKESTVWGHFANLIEHRQLSVWRILPKSKIFKIVSKIKSKDDKLKEIKDRIGDNRISFDEIACVVAWVKCRKKKPNNFK